ncbi:MAG: 2-iminoacetate synthase ThiH [Candidatus Hydrogenedentes bacterium]|nr:2-iminoacetate synthase ThiH [Candidatus Hydrogenedentota bacterium]
MPVSRNNRMRIQDELAAWPAARVTACIDAATPADVDRALSRDDRTPQDLCALLSPHAAAHLEPIAREAQRLTRWHFGRTIGMYAPLYISNVCGADCTYCGYAVRSGNREKRRTLTHDEIRAECETLAAQGFQSVLLLTGEARRAVPPAYIGEAVSIAHDYFASVAVEVYTLDQSDYEDYVRRGLDGVTIYMETYDRTTYADVHLIGEKSGYDYRLEAIERAGRAGVRRLSIGALLGLTDWRLDGFWTALHARHVQRACWQSAVSVSFPRLRHVPERFHIPQLVTDKQLVQLLLALRLFLPEAGFNLSTRETAEFRDRLVPLGVTMMSAGSSTRPGGYSLYGEETLEQFEIEDRRPAPAVAAAIQRAGYEPVWKDYDHAFDIERPERVH